MSEQQMEEWMSQPEICPNCGTREGHIDKLEAELAEARNQAVGLWKLLDDIDTASDMFKDNYEAFAGYVYRVQRERFDIVSGEQFDAMCDALEVKA